MPSSVVHAGFALLLAVGLLGPYFDRRAVAALVAVLLVPEADTVAGFVLDGVGIGDEENGDERRDRLAVEIGRASCRERVSSPV